jgi:hypothetical protein
LTNPVKRCVDKAQAQSQHWPQALLSGAMPISLGG